MSQNYISELFNLSNSELLILQNKGKNFSKININEQDYLIFFNHKLVNEIGVNKGQSFVKGIRGFPLRVIMGNGLLTSDGSIHLRDRRIIQPSFSKENIEQYLEIFTIKIKQEVLSWENEQIDFYTLSTKLLLSIISLSLFNVDFSKLNNFSKIIQLLIDNNSFNDHYQEKGQLKKSMMLQKKEQIKNLSNILNNVIDERKKSKDLYKDVLNVLLNNKSHTYSDKEIKDHIATLIVSGYPTTLSLVSWCIFLISQNKNILNELQKEADDTLWIKENRSPTLEEIHKNYGISKKIIKETLRLYPPVWVMTRQAKEDVDLHSIKIPKGSNILISQYVLHRDEKVFEFAKQWNPHRWTEDFEKSLPKGSYIPFAQGSRKCIGYEFAIAETQMILLLMAKHFSWKSVQNFENFVVKPSITLRPEGNVPIVLTKRV